MVAEAKRAATSSALMSDSVTYELRSLKDEIDQLSRKDRQPAPTAISVPVASNHDITRAVEDILPDYCDSELRRLENKVKQDLEVGSQQECSSV